LLARFNIPSLSPNQFPKVGGGAPTPTPHMAFMRRNVRFQPKVRGERGRGCGGGGTPFDFWTSLPQPGNKR